MRFGIFLLRITSLGASEKKPPTSSSVDPDGPICVSRNLKYSRPSFFPSIFLLYPQSKLLSLPLNTPNYLQNV